MGYDIYHPATQTSQNARELSDENLIWFYPTFLVVKASWKHIDILIIQKYLRDILQKNISWQNHLSRYLARRRSHWATLDQLGKMSSIKVLIFLLGTMVIFMKFQNTSAASLFDGLDGRIKSKQILFHLTNVLDYASLVFWETWSVAIGGFFTSCRFIYTLEIIVWSCPLRIHGV